MEKKLRQRDFSPNLYAIKQKLKKTLAEALGAYHDQLYIIDGLPMPVCKFARAYFSRIFKREAAYGYCATKKENYYGFRGPWSLKN